MSNLTDFFRDLLNREGQQYRELTHPWPQELRNSIVVAFENAVSESSVKGSICQLKPNSRNQSIGNQVEKYVVTKLGSVISGFLISKCRGRGYPDQTLIQKSSNLRIPLEMKATSNWNDKDTNRRVLTSSSGKLRAEFTEPIYHLLLTALYSDSDRDLVTIDTIRLDFLEPTTTVNVRFEASMSHKILVNDPHCRKIF